jgi:hypothetical protein
MLDVEAKGGGEICAAPSRTSKCWSHRFFTAVLVLLTRERSTIEDVVAQL